MHPDPDATTAAVTEDEIAHRAWRRLVKLKAFYGHLAVYVAVNTMLHLINLFGSHRYWAIWPLLGWGIAIALQAASTFNWPLRLLAPDWESRKLRQFADEERRRAGAVTPRSSTPPASPPS
jgi:hypothetical protein